jgi:terminase small subunit / prophage DNA-packing protein
MNLEAMTAVEFGKFVGVSEKTVRNWMNNNGLPFSEAGRGRVIESVAAVRWYVGYCHGSDGKSVKNSAPVPELEDSEDYGAALARKTRAEADLKELQLAERRGQVASIEDVEKVVTASSLATKTQIEGLPAKLATQLVGIDDRNTVQKLLAREMSQLLTNLASIDAIRELARSNGEDD